MAVRDPLTNRTDGGRGTSARRCGKSVSSRVTTPMSRRPEPRDESRPGLDGLDDPCGDRLVDRPGPVPTGVRHRGRWSARDAGPLLGVPRRPAHRPPCGSARAAPRTRSARDRRPPPAPPRRPARRRCRRAAGRPDRRGWRRPSCIAPTPSIRTPANRAVGRRRSDTRTPRRGDRRRPDAQPARSAMVRATRSNRSVPRPLADSASLSSTSRWRAASSRAQAARSAGPRRRAFRRPRLRRRATTLTAAIRGATSVVDSGSRAASSVWAGTRAIATVRSIRSRNGPETPTVVALDQRRRCTCSDRRRWLPPARMGTGSWRPRAGSGPGTWSRGPRER